MNLSAPDIMQPPAVVIPIADVLAQVQLELGGLAKVMEERQYLVRKNSQDVGTLDRDHMRAMQSIDYIGQNLNGIADFLKTLASSMPPDWTVNPVNAAQVVKLAELASRLKCLPDNSAVQHEESEGSCDFF